VKVIEVFHGEKARDNCFSAELKTEGALRVVKHITHPERDLLLDCVEVPNG
jgi:hypothetical protein